MKRFYFFTLIILLSISIFTHAQKPEKINFEGYIKNQPRLYLPNEPYSVKYDISDWFKDRINNDSLKLELKGYSEGSGYTIIFISDDPELAKEAVEQREMGTNKIIYKALVEARSNAKVQVITKDNEIAYEFSIKPNLFHANEEGLGTKPTKEEALTDCDAIAKRNGDKMKKAFVREVVREYQDTLDALFGKFNKKEKFQIFTVKPKDFNYDDYNGAAAKFQTACSTPEINTTELATAIELWEKCVLEYAPGKKTRISDVNIDELYLNLTQAYLVKEDYNNAKKYWNKCTEYKGNRMIEGVVQKFYDQQLEHVAYYPVSEKNYAPTPVMTSTMLKNRSLVFNFIFGFYLSEMKGIRIIQDYFPLAIQSLTQMESTYSYGDDLIEKFDIDYQDNGTPYNVKYTLTVTDEKVTKKNYEYNFLYKNRQPILITQNGKEKFKMVYDGDVLKEIFIKRSEEKNTTFIFNYAENGRINITAHFKEGDKTFDSTQKYYVNLDENGCVISYFIDVYSAKKLVYDNNLNWIGMNAVNESTGNEYTIDFQLELDKYGHFINKNLNNDFKIERKYKYIE